MARDPALKLEREKRKTQRQQAVLEMLRNPALQSQLALIGGVGLTFAMGKSRIINRDLAGVLCGLSAVVAAGNAGVRDRYTLLGIWSAVAAAYAMAVRPTEQETWFELQPTSLLGSDRKLFWWSMEDVAKATLPPAGAYYAIEDLVKGG